MNLCDIIPSMISALIALGGVALGSHLATISQERLARANYQYQLRLTALDKRLEKHQEAFRLWSRLYEALHSPVLQDVVYQCQEWWKDNCVYLTPEIADRFVRTYNSAANHPNLIAIWRESGSAEDSAKVKENFEFIRELGGNIHLAVGLPSVAREMTEGISPFGVT